MNNELDLEAIRQSPRQFVDLETVITLSDRCMALQAAADEIHAARIYLREKGRLLAQLAAGQAREPQLREALENAAPQVAQNIDYWCGRDAYMTDADYLKIKDAIALPQDTSALEDLIAKAGEVMRQRSMRVAWNIEPDANGPIESGIRALPGVTLDDIK